MVKQDQRAARDGAGARVHEQDAQGEQHEAVERDVTLAQDVLDDVRVAVGGGGGRDHEEPEEGAEAQHQDRRVEREAAPLHTHGCRANCDEDRGEQEGIEAEEEDVANRRKRVDAEDPVRGVEQVADRVYRHRGGEECPGPLDHGLGRFPGSCGGENRRAEARREVGVQLEDLESRTAGSFRKGQEQRDRYIDEEADRERARPAGDERLAYWPGFAGVPDRRHAVGANSKLGPPRWAGFQVDICSLSGSGANCDPGLESDPGQ